MIERTTITIVLLGALVLIIIGGMFIYLQQFGSSDSLSQATGSPTTTAQGNFYGTSTNINAAASDSATGTDAQQLSTGQETNTTSGEQEVAAWEAAVGGNGSVTCDINPDQESAVKEGLLHVKSGQFFKKMVRQDGTTAYKLAKNDKTYRWEKGLDAGVVTSKNTIYSDLQNSTANSDQGSAKKNSQSYANVIRTEKYECQRSQLGDKKFQVPENIEFLKGPPVEELTD